MNSNIERGLTPLDNFSIEIIQKYCLKSFEAFDFQNNFLNSYFSEVYQYVCCDYRQLEAEGLLMFGFILKYGGFKDILPYYFF